jgi:GH25 family lysozyme M1 (1,4-beta-N-acetylmuramidase)
MRPGRRWCAAMVTIVVAAMSLVALTALPAAALPSGYSVGGTDVSNNDGTIDWAQTAAKGVRFGWAKATEGLNFVDGQFNANYHGAKNNGVYIGAYAFGRPDKGAGTGKAQADYLVDHAQYVNDGKTLPLQLDIEWPYWTKAAPIYPCYGLSTSQMVTWIHDFVNEVKARTGRDAAIYTNTNWWNPCTGNSTAFSANPLETSNYSGSPGTLPAGWSRFTAWQYAGSSSTLPGSPTVFNGTLSDLAAFAGGSATGRRIGVVHSDGSVYVKEGALSAGWTLETGGGTQVVVSGDRIGVLHSDGSVYVKEGALSAGWTLETGGAEQIALSGDRIAVLHTDGSVYVKEGSLSAGWTLETGGGTQVALSGDRIGVLHSDGSVYVKEGSLSAGWTLETGGGTQIDLG